MNTDTWINRSEREPSPDDYPAWFCCPNSGVQLFQCICPADHYTHWMPAKLPDPPKPERKSFKDLDRETWRSLNPFMTVVESHHAGAQHVRDQVRAVIGNYENSPHHITSLDAVNAIRALVEEESP